jgi:hypothetical protein
MSSKNSITRLLPRGAVASIAKTLGLTPGTTSTAIRRANPGHPAVREALRIAQESGALDAAKTLATLHP